MIYSFSGWCELQYYGYNNKAVAIAIEPISKTGRFLNMAQASVIRGCGDIIQSLYNKRVPITDFFIIVPRRKKKQVKVLQILQDGTVVKIGSIEQLESYIGTNIIDWEYAYD